MFMMVIWIYRKIDCFVVYAPRNDILVSIEQHQTIPRPASLGGTDMWLGCTGAPLPCGLRPRCARSSSPLLCGARAPNQLRCFNRATPNHNKTRLVGRVLLWWVWLGSNQRPLRCQRSAHTTELHTHHLMFLVYNRVLNLASIFTDKLVNI